MREREVDGKWGRRKSGGNAETVDQRPETRPEKGGEERAKGGGSAEIAGRALGRSGPRGSPGDGRHFAEMLLRSWRR